MTNITKEIWRYIDLDPNVRIGLLRGYINRRSLALYLIKQHRIDESINAVLSAIRRYEHKVPIKQGFNQALELIETATMSSKNGIVSISLERGEEVEKRLPELISTIGVAKHHVLRLIHANESLKLIIDKKNLDKVKKIIPENKIRKIEGNLAEVTVHMVEKTWTAPGVASILTTELFTHGVNIYEIMSCIPEIILFFKEDDLMKAYTVLHNLAKKS